MDRSDAMAALYRAAVDRSDPAEAQRLEVAIESEPAPVPEPYYARPYALWYAEHGFPVFPLSTGAKMPLSGSRGLLDATTDVERVVNAFGGRSDYNIGIATGHVHDVVDIDGHDGMTTIVDKLSEDPGYVGVPIVAISSTPRGLHLWVPPASVGNSVGIMPGVDYRANGGYVVAPPSRLLDYADNVHEHYRWLMPPMKGDDGLL